MLTHALAAAAISISTLSWYCESGDPGGGGPTADIEVAANGSYKLTVNYNRKDLESAVRSSSYNFDGVPSTVSNVKQNGVDCVKSTFKARGQRAIEFLNCGDEDFAILRLVNFTASEASYEITCQ
jgi:hypothetical protein